MDKLKRRSYRHATLIRQLFCRYTRVGCSRVGECRNVGSGL